MKPRILAIVASVVLGALVIAGLFAVGSPGTARKFEADQARIRRLSELHGLLQNYHSRTGRLPSTLTELEQQEFNFSPEFDPRSDPETHQFFEYSVQNARTYRVCASFLTSSFDKRKGRYYEDPGYMHDRGRNCFTKTVTAFDVPRPLLSGPIPEPGPWEVAPIAPKQPQVPPQLPD